MAMIKTLSFILLFIFSGFVGARELSGFKPTKLFVFGDSYSDTGNVKKSIGNSWRVPYGITYPGKPTGRFSDGLLLTDYLAIFLKLKSPLSYVWRNQEPNDIGGGMNFAFGGSGVFFTYPSLPNMTTQIDYFENLLKTSFYTKNDLESAGVLVTSAGNDYAVYLANGGSLSNIKNFIPRVVNQLVTNLKRIQQLGAKKIVVGGLQPLGCLPRMTASTGYKKCIEIQNTAVAYHNALLRQAIEKLNGGSNKSTTSTFLLLDLYQAFETVISTKKDYEGKLRFETPLKPCCEGKGNGNNCASVDSKGTALYTVCSDRSTAFFWDSNHPTHEGWRTVFSLVQRNVEQFFGN